jgi:hypothetical protein
MNQGKEKFDAPSLERVFKGLGVLQIGIKAWKQHLARLGSCTSRIKTLLEKLWGSTLPYPPSIRKVSKPLLREEKNLLLLIDVLEVYTVGC